MTSAGRAALSTVAMCAALGGCPRVPDAAPETGPKSAQIALRWLNESSGLTVPSATGVAQGAQGFIWISTTGGLYRFDGHRCVQWASDVIRNCRAVTTSVNGDVVASNPLFPIWEVAGDGVVELHKPDGSPFVARLWPTARHAMSGELWITEPDRIWVRSSGEWRSIPNAAFGGAKLNIALPVRGDTAFVATDSTLWLTTGDGQPRPVSKLRGVRDGFFLDATRGYFLGAGRRAWRWTAPEVESIDQDLPYEGWQVVGDDAHGEFITLRAGERRSYDWTPLTDHEGNVWMPHTKGIIHIPRPTVATFPDISPVVRLTGLGDSLHVTTWFNRFVIAPTDSGYVRKESPAPNMIWVDGWGRWWSCFSGGFWVREPNGDTRVHPFPSALGGFDGWLRTDGRLWLPTVRGLFLSPRDGGAPTRPGPPPPHWGEWNQVYTRSILEDAAGRLWLSVYNEICSCSADSLARGLAAAWTCDSLLGEHTVRRFTETAGGRIWAAGEYRGVWVLDGDRWRIHPITEDVLSIRIGTFMPSPRGGQWICGTGYYYRVVDAPGESKEYRLLESLGEWQGLETAHGFNVVENQDGSLWVSENGVTHIPRVVRDDPLRPPRVAVIGRRANGEPLPSFDAIEISHDDNAIEVHFAALTFRARSHLRYQTKLNGEPWRETTELSARFVNLPFGRYEFAFRASLDGVKWSPRPASVSISVPRPWYRSYWGYALCALIGIGGIYGLHRVQLGQRLRLARQRTEIAMDLHDEIGAGLAAIGLAADAGAARETQENTQADPVAPESAGTTTTDPFGSQSAYAHISSEARQLSHNVSDLVWALRIEPELGALARYLGSRGRALFAASPTEFSTDFPDHWPDTTTRLDVHRNLQLILVEAMVNAAKHARAHRVTLRARERTPGVWDFSVADDGVSMAAAQDDAYFGSRAGLEGMRARAEAASIRLSIDSDSSGTRVVATIRVGSDSARLMSRLRRVLGR